MRNLIILCIILLTIIAGLAFRYFNSLSGKDNNLTDVLSATPADAAIIISFRNDESFYEIFKDYNLFEAIAGPIKTAEAQALSAMLRKGAFAEVTKDRNIFVSCHPSADSVELLYHVNIGNTPPEALIKESLSTQGYHLEELPGKIFRFLGQDAFSKPFYFAMHKGVVSASSSYSLIKSVQRTETAKLDKATTRQIAKSLSKNFNSPVYLFINHPALPPFIAHLKKQKAQHWLALIQNMRGFASLSMNFKRDAIMFNGLSSTEKAGNHYLNLFLKQKPIVNNIKNVLPENTGSFIAFGISDRKRFQTDVFNYLSRKKKLIPIQKEIEAMQQNTGVNAVRDLEPYLDKEFVLAETAYGEEFALIKVTNGRELNFKLQLISNAYNSRVGRLQYKNLWYYYFGEPFQVFMQPFFGVADNYLILANTPGIINNFISAYENDQTLINNEDFRTYDQLMANQSNVLYYVNRKQARRTLASQLKTKYARLVNEEHRLGKFYAFSYQWASDGDHFFTNLYLSHNPSYSIALNNSE